jgi:hypothetical protein
LNHTHRILTLATLAAAACGALAAPFTPGNIVISRIGDGSAALNSAATAVFLDEYTTAGVFVQTVALPTADSGANQTVTNSGSATSEGFVRRSQNGAYLMVVGYDAPTGTASVATTLSATFNRVIARVAADGTIDSTTAFDAYSAGNVRSAVSIDGTAFWVAGTGTGTGAAATGGSRYIPFGAAQTSVLLSESPTNVRANLIFGGQLYISSNSGAFRGVSAVGTGLPTSTGNTGWLRPDGDAQPVRLRVRGRDHALHR